ncbi:alkaline phosphatase [Litorimonas taeanensis]|uniref:Alkaline phosphatase n=1 Tax=Litorimonas taeanensis TaxID=568099 RepID=A0A420WDW7_9PROT|nr:alkaline phosphatase [Litorimonas taeanensis]RKQ69178.1 alkaline phosphatase [Litorimonas taeanensis]
MPFFLPSAKRIGLLCTLGLTFSQLACAPQVSEKTNSASESAKLSSADAQKKLKKSENNSAKNIILFVGDGMGVSTVTAARIFDGQSQGKSGEENTLAFEEFQNVALIKTYNTNSQVPDSAGTATAMMSGYKTNIGAVNVLPKKTADEMLISSCQEKADLPTLTDKAKSKAMSVGIISTARLTHATPASMYGHSVSRDWEAEKDITDDIGTLGCKSLSQQLVESQVDLALGGGSKEFTDEQLSQWPGKVVTTAADMQKSGDEKLLGLFNRSHMSFEADRADTEEPSLSDMTAFAIERLSNNEDGYVLMVEAGRIDHAHHGTNAFRALKDTQALNEAVKTALAKTGDDTLIVVTADHSHVFTMAGYPTRGNPILGLVKTTDRKTGEPSADYVMAEDGKPYTTLGYHNGPNQRTDDSPALTDNMVQSPDFHQQTSIPLGSETHGGEDVPLYATGPGAEYFRGVMEQDEIGQILGDIIANQK